MTARRHFIRQESVTLRSLSLAAAVSHNECLREIYILPRSLQMEALTQATYSFLEESVSTALLNCDFTEISEEQLARTDCHMKDASDVEEGVRSLMLIYGYLHALKGPLQPRALRKVTTDYLFGIDFHLEAFKSIRKKLDVTQAGTYELVLNGVIVFNAEGETGESNYIAWDILNFIEGNGNSYFKLTLSEVEVVCFGTENSLEKSLETLEPGLQGLTFRVQYPVYSSLTLLRKFANLQKLAIRIQDSREEVNYFKALGEVLPDLGHLEYIDIGDGMLYTSGDVSYLLNGLKKSLTGFRFGGIDISEEDISWLTYSKHSKSLEILDFGSANLFHSDEIINLVSGLPNLGELVLDECKLTKRQVIKIVRSLTSCTKLYHLRLNQYLLLASSYSLMDSLEILKGVLSLSSPLLQYAVIDAPSDPMNVSHPSVHFIAECKRLIKETGFKTAKGELIVNFEPFEVTKGR